MKFMAVSVRNEAQGWVGARQERPECRAKELGLILRVMESHQRL